MTRQCSVDDCTNDARPQRTVCNRCRQRIRLYGDPHFTQWTVADDYDVELIATEERRVPGLTRLERKLVALRMTDRGVSARRIAEFLEVEPRTVHRWRSTAASRTA